MNTRPNRLRIWLYGIKSYATFGKSGPIEPDWLWRSRRFFDWIRIGRIVVATQDGEPIVSRETENPSALRLRCHWFGLDLFDPAHNQKTRIYALVPWVRVQEMREALGITEATARG